MSSNNLLSMWGFACLLIVRVAAYSLTMTPDHVRVSSRDLQTVTFTCSAGVALAGCQFTWRDDYYGKEGPLLDLSRGSLSQANSTHLTSTLTGYSYSGQGLGAGDCGVTLKVTGHKEWMVVCRVRAGNGGWSYAWADLYASHYGPISHTRTQREAVVLQGGEARFALKAQGPLKECDFYLPGKELVFDQGSESAHSAGRHRYLGAGLQSGECGLAVSNVSEEDNGPVRGWINAYGNKDEHRYMTLIVASPPSAPTLSVVYTETSVTATCEVKGARPVAHISWILGDDVIRQDTLVDFLGKPQDAWRWPWMKGSVMQRLTLTLQTKDNGKVLKCVVSHVTLARPLEATETILFTEAVSVTTPLAVSSATPGATLTTTRDPTTTLDPSCTAASMLGHVCQEYKGLHNATCPRDEVYELRVREAGAAARTAELAEEHANVTLEAAKVTLETAKVTLEAAKAEAASNASLAKVTLEAAKAEAASNASLAKVTLEAAKVTLEAAKVTLEAAKAEAASNASLAKVTLEAAKAEAASNASLAKVTLETAKVTLEAAKVTLGAANAYSASNASLAKGTLDAAQSIARYEASRAQKEASDATAAQLGVEGARDRAKADQAWRIYAEEELEFERARRSESLLQLQSAQG